MMSSPFRLGTMCLIQTPDDARRLAPMIRDAGYTCVQAHLGRSDMTHQEVERVGEVLRAHGLSAAAVCCHLARNRAVDFLFSSRDGIHWLIKAGAILGAPRLVIWSGSYVNDFRGEHPDNTTDRALDHLESEFARFVPAAERAGIQVCIEPFYPEIARYPVRHVNYVVAG